MNLGKLFVALGAVSVIIGALFMIAPGIFNWFGRLPGDIRVEGENRYFFFPITSMIVISVVITLIINLFFRK